MPLDDKPTLLTRAELEAYNGGPGRGVGQFTRYRCPIHGGDNPTVLQVDEETGRFFCFKCSAKGYLSDHPAQVAWKKEGRERGGERRERRERPVPLPKPAPEARPELAKALAEMQDELRRPGSWGADYLTSRRIPLDLALRHGLGYARYGAWPHLKEGKLCRQCKCGRVVIPHTDPQGRVVNLYGRGVERVLRQEDEPFYRSEAWGNLKHAHLPGPKGNFNAISWARRTVILVEGPFDALALLAAGYPQVVAVFGVNGIRWDWAQAPQLVFAFDADATGKEQWVKLAREAAMRGKDVQFVPAEAYQGCKDWSELWAKGVRPEIGQYVRL